MKLSVGSLFAGIGGIELGLEWAGGFETVWQVENDSYATKVLEKHWPKVKRWNDVRTFPPKPVEDWQCDLICGGFPCQDISYAGKGAGLEGERSGLWWEFARVVRTLRPRYVLVENVGALLTRGIDAVLGTLASLGYDAEWHCIPAAAVGAPHIRDRVFILGYAEHVRSLDLHQDTRGVKSQQSQMCEVWESQRAGNVPSDVADADGSGNRPQYRGSRPQGTSGSASSGSSGLSGIGTMANGNIEGPQDITQRSAAWWSTEPDVGRVANGVPSRVDRLRCLGNAVVPQVAQWIGEQILRFDRSKRR